MRHHDDEAEGDPIQVKMAIAHYLSIPLTHIKTERASQKTSKDKRGGRSLKPIKIKKYSPKHRRDDSDESTRDQAKEVLARIHRGSPSRAGRKGRPPVPLALSDIESDDNDSYSYAGGDAKDPKEEVIKRIQRKRKSPGRKKASPKAVPAQVSAGLAKPRLEYSLSRRTRCQVCQQRIPKGAFRVGVQSVYKGLHHNEYYHPECCPDDLKKILSPDHKKKDIRKFWNDQRQEMDEYKEQRQHTIEVERAGLRRRLRKLRRKLHEEQGAKADGRALIISLETIDNIVFSKPTTKTALMNVRGIGKQMYELYGRALLKEVSKYVSNEQESDSEESDEEQSPAAKRLKVRRDRKSVV